MGSKLKGKYINAPCPVPAAMTATLCYTAAGRTDIRPRAHSSVGQSSRLIIGRSLVRVQLGPPGSGKHALSRELCRLDASLSLMKTITTRKKRNNELSTEIQVITKEVFEARVANGDFFYINRKKEFDYAYSKKELKSKILNEKIPIFVFHSNGGIALKKVVSNVPTIFLTANIETLFKRCERRGSLSEAIRENIRRSLTRNQEAYHYYLNHHDNCILVDNSEFNPPLSNQVVKTAVEPPRIYL